MCSIFGSKDRNRFIHLAKQNQFRGNFSHSISIFRSNGIFQVISKEFGGFREQDVPKFKDILYYIGHVQAPTGGLVKNRNRIHPAKINNAYLFHNGIIKESCLKEITSTGITEVWDTKVFLNYLYDKNLPKTLSMIDGSFGCVYVHENGVKIFTSDIITLFYNDDHDISSIKTDKVNIRFTPNIIYDFDIMNDIIVQVGSFTSKSSPYFFIEGD